MLQWPGRSDEVSKRINDEIKKEHQLLAREAKKKERKSIVDKLNPFRTSREYEQNKFIDTESRRERRLHEKDMKFLLLGMFLL